MSLQGNKRKIELKGADFYPTPFWATEALLYMESFEGKITEPCCGEGHISEVLKNNNFNTIDSDLLDYNYGIVKNAFDIKEAENIITNPPYNLAIEMLEHFLKITKKKIALLLRLSFLESKKRYNFFQDNPPKNVLVFSERLSLSPKGIQIKGGGTISYAWFVWDKEVKNNITELKWIPPIFKNRKD